MSLGATYAQADPANLSSQEIYDRIMIQIEPDLVSHMIPLLEKIYANESEKERKARGERYKEAFTLFEERFGEMMDEYKSELELIKKVALLAQRVQSAEEDEHTLNNLSQSIDES